MFIVYLISFGVVLWFIAIFNLFVRDKNLIREALGGIDVQLKRRFDLIPNLVEAVKGYTKYERNVLEEVTNIRTKSFNAKDIKEKSEAESKLSGAIKTLFAVAESYPDLKASANFLDLQKNLSQIEDEIQLSRRYYNGNVRNYNIRVQSFPSNLVAGIFNFKEAAFFEIEYATERKAPEVKI